MPRRSNPCDHESQRSALLIVLTASVREGDQLTAGGTYARTQIACEVMIILDCQLLSYGKGGDRLRDDGGCPVPRWVVCGGSQRPQLRR